MSTVTVDQVAKSFGSVRAVQDVSFEVGAGEIFGLLGPNGAGKTTTIRMMMDILRPDHGTISVLGGSLDEQKKDRIGYMPEERGLYQDLRLETTLVYLATLKGLDAATARRRLRPWLERLDLFAQRGQKIQELSKGMQQKAQIIATLVHEPDLIVIDEPFSGLDPVNTRLVKEIIEEQRQAGRTVIMSTHQMHQVEALCSRIVLIDHGQSVLYGQVTEIKQQFGGNALHIEGKGTLGDLAGVLERRPINGGWQLTLAPGTDPQSILQQMVVDPNYRIERFQIAEPSLEDVFVAVVQQRRQGDPVHV